MTALHAKQRSSRWLSRRTLLLGLGGLGLAGIGGGGYALWKYHDEHTALAIYKGYNGTINAVAWSPDGKRIACAGDPADKSFEQKRQSLIHILDASTVSLLLPHIQPLSDLYEGNFILMLAWSPDGSRLAYTDLLSTYIWNMRSGGFLQYPPKTQAYVGQGTLAWSPDGSRIVSGGDGGPPVAQSWDASSGKDPLDYTIPSPGKPMIDLHSVAWSPDGAWIATASAIYSGAYIWPLLQIWQAASGHLLLSYQDHSHGYGHFTSVSWSPTSQRIALADTFGLVRIWDVPTQKVLLTYEGHAHLFPIQAVRWSPNGQWICSGSDDTTVQVWNPSSGTTAYTYRGHSDPITSLAWSPDSARVATGSGETVHIWQSHV